MRPKIQSKAIVFLAFIGIVAGQGAKAQFSPWGGSVKRKHRSSGAVDAAR